MQHIFLLLFVFELIVMNIILDILLDQLNKAKTVERILELASNHLDVMNAQHIVALLQGIHATAK